MMRSTWMALCVCALLSAQPLPATGQNQPPPRKPDPGTNAGTTKDSAAATRYWYEDGKRRTLQVDPAWVADFASPAAAQPGKRPSPLKRSIGGEKALESLPSGVSPVFRDDHGAQRALAGGIVVRLRQADLQDARARLAAAGLLPIRPIDPEGRTWLVASPAGMPSLDLANQMHESGRFESATPNWWRPRALK